MHGRRWLLWGALLLTACAGATVWTIWDSTHETVRVLVDGPAGTTFEVTGRVDGETSAFEGIVPARFEVTGRDIAFTVRKDESPGRVSVRIESGRNGYAATSAGPGASVDCGFEVVKRWPPSTSIWACAHPVLR